MKDSESIRPGTPQDLGAPLELWQVSGARLTTTDDIGPLSILLDADPESLLIADAGGQTIGSLIAAWNGWRGSFYRLAVHPEHRRCGLATRLVRAGEERLRRCGAIRIDAIVDGDHGALEFWKAVGYERQGDRSRFVRDF